MRKRVFKLGCGFPSFGEPTFSSKLLSMSFPIRIHCEASWKFSSGNMRRISRTGENSVVLFFTSVGSTGCQGIIRGVVVLVVATHFQLSHFLEDFL